MNSERHGYIGALEGSTTDPGNGSNSLPRPASRHACVTAAVSGHGTGGKPAVRRHHMRQFTVSCRATHALSPLYETGTCAPQKFKSAKTKNRNDAA